MTSVSSPTVRRNLAVARDAFRCRLMASHAAMACNVYREHNLFAEAQASRATMLAHLREARRQWRRLLGITS